MKQPKSQTQPQDLFGDLLQAIDTRYADIETVSFYDWVQSGLILDGQLFSFKDHKYLETPYKDEHPDVTFLKGAQLGLTTLGMLRTIYGARYRGLRGILYLFPSRSDTSDFSKSRIAPLIAENPDNIGQWVKDTDAVNIKQIHNAFVYFRGMRSKTGLKSIPVDYLVLDELDESPDLGAIAMAQERLSHSRFQEILKLSNPSIPDYGVSSFFNETDQRFYLLKCPKCGEWTDLVGSFPDTLHTVDDKVIRACFKCGAELDINQGEWVAKRPDVKDKRGYQFSQLHSAYVNPKDILHQFRTTPHMQEFMNLKIGLPHIEAENRLSIEEILALCSDQGIASSDPGPSLCGIDVGATFHVVIGKRRPGGGAQITHIGEYKEFSELDRLMKNFNITRCVIDGLPETHGSRSFANRHKGKVFLSYYSTFQKGSYRWNEKELTVTSNRTESLDASHKQIMDGNIVLPKECDVTREFAQHCHNVARKIEESEETGSKRYVYVKLGDDHWRHSFNYFCMAESVGHGSLFSDYDLS